MTTTASTQLRDDNYRTLINSGAMSETCVTIYRALLRIGKGTTREIAGATGIGLLTVRPRVTRLKEEGLVVMVGRHGGEGVYACAEWVRSRRGVEAAARIERPNGVAQTTTTEPILPGFGDYMR